MWYLSGPGTEPVSPVLAGRFFTTEPPVVIQSLSHVQLVATSWTVACLASLSFTISQSLLKFMFIESVMPCKHLVLCCPFSCLQSFPASGFFLMSQATREALYCLLSLYFIYFCSDLYDFFPSTNFGFCLFFYLLLV